MRNLEETFEYDSQNRLKRVRLGPTLTGASVYDSYGRMTAKTANGQLIFYNAEFGTTAKPLPPWYVFLLVFLIVFIIMYPLVFNKKNTYLF